MTASTATSSDAALVAGVGYVGIFLAALVAINATGPIETNAHLLKYDSVHGRFPGVVKVSGNELDLGRGPIRVMSTYNPEELDWDGVDVVLECTGKFNDRDKAAVHLGRGAKRVLVSAPAKQADKTVVYGVNHRQLTADHLVVSNGSCTTEVKSLRDGHAQVADAFARIINRQVWLDGVHIPPYQYGHGVGAHDPNRARKLLMHRRLIDIWLETRKTIVLVTHDSEIAANAPRRIVIRDGKIIATYLKRTLPNYTVFDEERYFDSGDSPCVFEHEGVRVGIHRQRLPGHIAGVIAAETIRKYAPHDEITIVGDEPEPPYSRMAIPYLLIGNVGEEGTHLRHGASHFALQRIESLANIYPVFRELFKKTTA